LLEYQKYRAAATDLDRLPVSGRDVFVRGSSVDLPPLDPGLAPITLFRLAEAYNRVLERARIHKSHEVVLEQVTVAQRMEQLTMLLADRGRFEFEALFLDRSWSSEGELRSMLVITLMSILELTKLGVVHVHQPFDSVTIVIERRADFGDAKKILASYEETTSFGPVAGHDEGDQGTDDPPGGGPDPEDHA
jgi:segregation and condensation protein A